MREKEFGSGPSGLDDDFRESKISVYSASGIARLLLAFVSLYIAFASLTVCLLEVEKLRFYNLYYLFVMCACAYASLRSLREVRFGRPAFSRQKRIRLLVLAVLGLAAWGVYRLPHLFAYSLWIDEITQFQGDWNLPRTMADPAIFAAIQQQPPADYYLSAFARILLGTSEFAVQFHAIAFGILSLFLFLVWLAQIRFPLALAPIPIVLFAAHHTLLRFSSEARPISLAVFFSIAAMIFVFESVQRKKSSARVVAVSSILLLYSVGLQPMFFLPAMAIGLLPLLFWRFGRGEAAKFLLAFGAVPLLLFLPTLWEIYRESERQNQFFSSSYLDLWWQALKAMNWQSFSKFRLTISRAEWVVLVPFAALLAATLAKAVRFKRLPGETGYWAWAGVVFSLLFPAAFQVFWSIINWNQNLYYFVLWPVGLFTLGSLCVAMLLRPLMEAKAGKWAEFVFALASVAAIYQLHQTYIPSHRTRIEHDHGFRPNWREVVKLAQHSKNPALILEIPYGSFGWPPYHSVTGQFYENPPDIRVVRLEIWNRNNFGIPPFRIREPLKSLDNESDIFYLITLMDDPGSRLGEERRQKILSVLRENSDEIIQVRAGNYLARVRNQLSPVESTKRIFAKLIEADPQGDRNFYLADALAADAIHEGSCKEARRWFSVMKITDEKFAQSEGLKKHLAKKEGQINQIPGCAGK